MMEDYCAFSKDHKCLKWEDYELTRHELEEADRLCHGNWIKIQKLYRTLTNSELSWIKTILITRRRGNL